MKQGPGDTGDLSYLKILGMLQSLRVNYTRTPLEKKPPLLSGFLLADVLTCYIRVPPPPPPPPGSILYSINAKYLQRCYKLSGLVVSSFDRLT